MGHPWLLSTSTNELQLVQILQNSPYPSCTINVQHCTTPHHSEFLLVVPFHNQCGDIMRRIPHQKIELKVTQEMSQRAATSTYSVDAAPLLSTHLTLFNRKRWGTFAEQTAETLFHLSPTQRHTLPPSRLPNAYCTIRWPDRSFSSSSAKTILVLYML